MLGVHLAMNRCELQGRKHGRRRKQSDGHGLNERGVAGNEEARMNRDGEEAEKGDELVKSKRTIGTGGHLSLRMKHQRNDGRSSARAPRQDQNIVLGFAEVCGTNWSTSQCSTILPSASSRKISMPAQSLSPGHC